MLTAAFSGGRSSAAMTAMMLMHGPRPDAVVMTNTGMESLETLEFARAFVSAIVEPSGVPFHLIEFHPTRSGRSWREVSFDSADTSGTVFLDGVKSMKAMPSRMIRNCTALLKIETKARFLRDRYGAADITTAIGIRADEPRRVAQMRQRNERTEAALNSTRKPRFGEHILNTAPLADAGWTQTDVRRWVASLPQWADVAKAPATRLSNCIGCFFDGSMARKIDAFTERDGEIGEAWVEVERWVSAAKQSKAKRRTYPAELHAFQLKHFNEPLPPQLRHHFTAHQHVAWQQIKWLADGRDGTLFDDRSAPAGGCMGAWCGTD